MLCRILTLLAVIMFCLGIPVASKAPEPKANFEGLGNLGGTVPKSSAWAVSGDGEVVVGRSLTPEKALFQEAFLWTPQGGIVGLGTLPSTHGRESYAWGVSADGKVIVGGSLTDIGATAIQRAFQWENGQMVDLETLDLPVSEARGISADGSVIVGGVDRVELDSALPYPEAVVWKNNMLVGLGQLPRGYFSEATAVSADGSVIVGYGYAHDGNEQDNSRTEAFRWENGQMVSLGDLQGGRFESEATAVSADGSVIVGYGYTPSGPEAFRLENGQMVGLGRLPGSDQSYAQGVSGGGSIVVGYVANQSEVMAFIWDTTHGMQSLQDVLSNDLGLGAQLKGWHLQTAVAISSDGKTIVGNGINPLGNEEAWRATLGSPIWPDLVTTSLDLTGRATVNSEGSVELPVRVVIANQGLDMAGVFKVSVEYQTASDPLLWYAVAFTVPGQNNIWYPYTDKVLTAQTTVEFRGTLTFNSVVHGEKVFLRAIADSCSGDEFKPDYCRVKESDEENNESALISLVLP